MVCCRYCLADFYEASIVFSVPCSSHSSISVIALCRRNTFTDTCLQIRGRLSILRRSLSYGAWVWMQAFMVFPCIRFSEGLIREDLSPSP